MTRPGDAVAAAMRPIMAMPRAPVFTLPRLDRLGDRLAADVARDRPRYRHQLSGGQRQRVMIAMAVALAPKLIVADEPTTALDVTTQAQILTLSDAPRRRHGTALLFSTHDVGVVAELADRVAVLQHRILVEAGRAADAFSARPTTTRGRSSRLCLEGGHRRSMGSR